MKHVVIFQRRLVHYRVEFFNRLKRSLEKNHVRLDLVVGELSTESILKRDDGNLGWAYRVKNREFNILGRELVWQRIPYALRNCDLAIVAQENKIISNYFLQVMASFGRRKIAFWGHGKNFQSVEPDGLAEKWKKFWLRRVDWWFAYTEMSKRTVVAAGFDATKVTVLNNSLDGRGLSSEINDISKENLSAYFEINGLSKNAIIGLYCGSLYAEKKVDFLIEAAVKLRQSLPSFHLLVLGAGPEQSKVIDAAAKYPWIHYKGMQKGREKAVAFKAASFLMNPGAVGLSVVESFIAARPIVTIASAAHGPEIEYLVNGQNALVLPSESVDVYVNEIVRLMNSQDDLERIRRRCSADADVYSLDSMVERFSRGILASINGKS